MAAPKSRLSKLHAMFTEALIAELEEASEGDNPIPLPAADKAVIAKFLKDNDITADVDDSSMDKLRDSFADDLEERRRKRAAEIMQRATEDTQLGNIL